MQLDEKTIFRKLVEYQYEMNDKNNKVLQEIAGSSSAMFEIAKEMREINKGIVDTLKQNTTGLLALEKFWGRIVMFLIGVLAILAGARGLGDLIAGL